MVNDGEFIYYFCEKKNITFNEKFNNREKYLFLSDYDTINELDKRFFTKIYTFNNFHTDCDKVEFIRFNLKKNDIITLFDNTTKENIKLLLQTDAKDMKLLNQIMNKNVL